MKKSFVKVVLLVLAFFLFGLFFSMKDSSAESLYIHKIVSVVFDDSGSMDGEKEAYANYAMQAFCGMLNSEDKLFITYMNNSSSRITTDEVILTSTGIQASVDGIRTHSSGGGTPIDSVEIAFEALKGVQDANENTQYWLVVFTDGVFDEIYTYSDADKVKYLNNKFEGYADAVMPNGTKPQISFLTIGTGSVGPDENKSKGIFTYRAENAAQITSTMAAMADKISGRTRLSGGDTKQTDGRTIQVSSTIPLLNMAVFLQGDDAKIESATIGTDESLPIEREVRISYPGRSDLSGYTALVGDSQHIISSGTYTIEFSNDVNVNDVVVLFEPALEVRMAFELNGKPVSATELSGAMENDTISVAGAIYEMGSDTEINKDLLPPGTKFDFTVSEDGKTVKKMTDGTMSLDSYTLRNCDTEINAAFTIEGFNPISYNLKFRPTEYVPKVQYTITAELVNGLRSVKYDTIGSNEDLAIRFTFFADGEPIKDIVSVKALNPVITTSPGGNEGITSFADDGTVLFTPRTANDPPSINAGSYDVTVKCVIDEGAEATAEYTVLWAVYEVFGAAPTDSIRKNRFYDNTVSASFYVTKDGVRLQKNDIESRFSIDVNEPHRDKHFIVDVSADGMVTVTPRSDWEWKSTFWRWFTNCWVYPRLTVKDLVVTFNSSYGTEKATIDVCHESVLFILLNVVAPIFVEVAIGAFLIWWILCILFKPRFSKKAVLYYGEIKFGDNGYSRHVVKNVHCVYLRYYNGIQFRLAPNMKPVSHSFDSVLKVTPVGQGGFKVQSKIWYKGGLNPIAGQNVNWRSLPSVMGFIESNPRRKMVIQELKPRAEALSELTPPSLPLNNCKTYYISAEDNDVVKNGANQPVRINKGIIFAYVNAQ